MLPTTIFLAFVRAWVAVGPGVSPDPVLTATWLPLELTQGVMAVQAEVSLPGWLGLGATFGTDGRLTEARAPLELAAHLRYYFLRPFSGFQVGVLGGMMRTDREELLLQVAPVAGYKWISGNGFTTETTMGWTWVTGRRQQAGNLLWSLGLGYTW